MRHAPDFDQYSKRYPHAAMQRDENGVLELTLHTDGESLVWTQEVHDELPYLFTDIAGDRENSVLLLTGAGDAWCDDLDFTTFQVTTAESWDNILYEGTRLLTTLLAITVPVVAAINGPVRFHSELPIMSDVVVASETAVFSDRGHFAKGVVPGDGAHVVWTHVLGPNRGRYYLLMGQELNADEAKAAGAVAEVLPPAEVLPRAREIARYLAAKPFLTRRYARDVLTREYRRLLADGVGTGLALQGLATQASWDH
ncbi:enoyl-CoA hydratase/isomerase family protein [Amycolatopsis sp. K13G38]|uniref:Enoyl-CoA hydratase/isomerase family protein n=1 Tax=Amycolatopsis acididurans TaxID=2724524 RepID=A0ABX1JC43_9PSEU|nr:enoyl-CoA hydratase/isomerase family protein [Amycolatopsis acididurans]NKQ56180.1 enoyl-CoA hydratase/isomerase family protein [Amycolatopsis acididurans]